MKILLPTVLFSLALAVSAQATITAGFNAGYMIDNEEEFLAAHIGTVFKTAEKVAHTGEFEIGFTSVSEGGIDGDILPLMANYRALFSGAGKLGGYVGLGGGMARTKVSGFGLSDNDWTFAFQLLGGLSYKMSETGSFDLGARYINIQDATLFGIDADLGDDVVIEAGFTFRF